jgi:hypothetical protein
MQTKVKVQTVPYTSTAKAGSFTEHLVKPNKKIREQLLAYLLVIETKFPIRAR